MDVGSALTSSVIHFHGNDKAHGWRYQMSYTTSYYHIIFHTLHNKPAIVEEHEKELYRYIWGLCRNKRVFLHRVGGMPNHLHLMVNLPPSLSVADFVRELKTSTNTWLKSNHSFPLFEGWSTGYAGLSYGRNDVERVVNYIKNQKRHHQGISFADEIRTLFKENGMEIQESYFSRDWIE